MAQFALLIILVIVVLHAALGRQHAGREPAAVAAVRSRTSCPSRHFVSFSQVIIYRGGGFWAVWQQFVMVAAIGLAFFVYSLSLFRKSIAVTK